MHEIELGVSLFISLILSVIEVVNVDLILKGKFNIYLSVFACGIWLVLLILCMTCHIIYTKRSLIAWYNNLYNKALKDLQR